MSVHRLSPFYANAYLLQAAQFLWQASVARKDTYPLPGHALNATLFTAFAAEAYVNTALERMLGVEDASALMRLPVAGRWTTGTRLVFGSPVFHAGEEPHTTLVRLFKERNRLVHARSLEIQYFDDPLRTHLPLRDVAQFILRVSQAVDELGRQAPELDELREVPQGLLRFDHQFANYDPARHADDLRRTVRSLRVALAEIEFGSVEELVGEGEERADLYWTREEDIEEEFPA